MFPLYHTFNKKLRSKPLSKKEKAMMEEIVDSFTKEESEKFIMLVFEHYRFSSGGSPIEATSLPFGMTYDELSKVVMLDFSKLQQPLQHILFKFCKLIKEKNSS